MTSFVMAVCFVVVIVFNNAQALSDADRDIIQMKIIDFGRDCFLENKVSAADLIALRDLKLPTSSNISCYLDCVFRKLNVIDSNGKVTPQRAKESAGKLVKDEKTLNGIEELLTFCSPEAEKPNSGRKCEGSDHIYKCILENREKFDITIKFKQN